MASDYIHGSSDEERERLSKLNALLTDACLREVEVRPGENIVDFGSGLGQFTRMMARAAGETATVLGIERDPQQIAQANRLSEASGDAVAVAFRQGDAALAPLQDSEWGTFDLAHARFLLEHVAAPERVVQQMAQAVRPGGRVFLCDDDHGDFRPWPEPPYFKALWRAYVGTFQATGSDPYIGRRLVSLMKEAGLQPVRNGGVFFGGCAGDQKFEATADNLIAAFHGAQEAMISQGGLDPAVFAQGIEALQHWKADAASALWYSACFAEGIAPV